MLGPGASYPDPTAGITHPEDVPKPQMVQHSRNFKHRPCPRCGKSSYRDRVCTRTLHAGGDRISGRPRDIALRYSPPYCGTCRKDGNAEASDLRPPKSQDTHRVIDLAIRLVVEDG